MVLTTIVHGVEQGLVRLLGSDTADTRMQHTVSGHDTRLFQGTGREGSGFTLLSVYTHTCSVLRARMVACSCATLSASPAASQLRSSAALASLTDAAETHTARQRGTEGSGLGKCNCDSAQGSRLVYSGSGSKVCCSVPVVSRWGAVCANYS